MVSTGWTPAALSDAILSALDRASELRALAMARGHVLVSERSPPAISLRWIGLIEDAIAEAVRARRLPRAARLLPRNMRARFR